MCAMLLKMMQWSLHHKGRVKNWVKIVLLELSGSFFLKHSKLDFPPFIPKTSHPKTNRCIPNDFIARSLEGKTIAFSP